jgi:glycosyltransferase involved in cell wall biosynthesis
MKISLITLTFNSEKTIKKTLESIVCQSLPPDELIIIDGGSTDSTLKIINSFNLPYLNIYSGKDNGIYDAMNKGLNLVRFDIVGFLNSDDYFSSSNVLFKIHDTFLNNDIDIFYANVNYITYDGLKVKRKWVSNKYFNNYFELGNTPAHPTFYIKKNILNNDLFFNCSYKLASDYDFMFKLLKIYSFKSYYLNESIVNMRLGGATNKSYRNILNQNIEIYKIWKSYNISLPFYYFPLKFFKKILQYL